VSLPVAARLVWERPDGEKVEFPLDQEALVVGREDAPILIDEPLVSRRHARIEWRDEAWVVVDLESTNHTRVNGEVVHYRDLADGDEVRFARAKCRFHLSEPAPADRPEE
jgi:pSer/pThr/pTyr-binding forkhead associated (FHA) protein